MRGDALRRFAETQIAAFGHAVVSEPSIPAITHTIGLYERHGYELVCSGLHGSEAGALLNAVVCDILALGRPLPFGEKIYRIGSMPVRFHHANAARASEVAPGAFDYYGAEVPLAQMVWPDAAGRFPGEQMYDKAGMAPLQSLLYIPDNVVELAAYRSRRDRGTTIQGGSAASM